MPVREFPLCPDYRRGTASRPSSFPRSAWERTAGRSAAREALHLTDATQSVGDCVHTRSVGTRGRGPLSWGTFSTCLFPGTLKTCPTLNDRDYSYNRSDWTSLPPRPIFWRTPNYPHGAKYVMSCLRQSGAEPIP